MRYAKALLQAGLANNTLDALYGNGSNFYEVLNKSTDFDAFLKNPIISGEARKKFIRKVFGTSFHGMMLNFINIIIDNRREKLIGMIFLDFINLYRESKGIKTVKVITAIPVDDEYRNEIGEVIEKRLNAKIELECKVDAETIGGLVIMVDDRLADGSVAGELRALKKKMMIY
ncbi:MAG: ATP synthase F1 subunit delta [Cytophagaceae bacterium]|nr:ATP synthase F1 subunit delta [Cytophagaceae bacterium]